MGCDPAECSADADCGAGYICEDGCCQDECHSCTGDGDCGEGKMCDKGCCAAGDSGDPCADVICNDDKICDDGCCKCNPDIPECEPSECETAEELRAILFQVRDALTEQDVMLQSVTDPCYDVICKATHTCVNGECVCPHGLTADPANPERCIEERPNTTPHKLFFVGAVTVSALAVWFTLRKKPTR